MKQTAVEWLVNQLSKNELFNIMKGRLSEKHNNFIKIEELINEAEQMEKQQIIEAVNFGDARGKITTYCTADEYYNETFKSE